MNRLVLFDCDGTLVDSQANICRCMENVFLEAGLPAPARRDIRRIVGLSLVPAMQALIPDAEESLHLNLAETYKLAFQKLRRQGMEPEPMFDGIREVIETLRSKGWQLGVATGKSDRGLRLCLDHHGLLDHFVTLQTADRHPSKPHPSMIYQAMAEAGAAAQTTVMIGDTSFDMAMAVAGGVLGLGVDWGYHEAHELYSAGAFAVISHPDQLLDALS